MKAIYRGSLVAAVLAAALAPCPFAWGQSNPSANQILDRLDPTVQGLHGQARGIRQNNSAIVEEDKPAQSVQASAPGAAHVHAAKPAADKPPSVDIFLEFASGSADLTPQTMAALDELGKALSSERLATYRFRVEGHTDTVGTKESNQALSQRRAAAVADYLERKFGVSSDRLIPVGVGTENLLVPTPPQTPEARNRRVQVINIGAS